jgi:hypothetical protein
VDFNGSLDRLRRSPALRAGRVKSRRPDWKKESLTAISGGAFFVATPF